MFVGHIATAPVCSDVNECNTNNGGCHNKRKCINLPGSMRCDNCQAGWFNDGAKGCKGECVGCWIGLLCCGMHVGGTLSARGLAVAELYIPQARFVNRVTMTYM